MNVKAHKPMVIILWNFLFFRNLFNLIIEVKREESGSFVDFLFAGYIITALMINFGMKGEWFVKKVEKKI